jgi:hypothetical protein
MRRLLFLLPSLILVFKAQGAVGRSGPVHPKQIEKKATDSIQWNPVCQDLLKKSVLSARALELRMTKKKKVTRREFESQVQNELLVVQLNAWVCATSGGSSSVAQQQASVLENLFFQDYSRLVQSKGKRF